MAMGEDRSESAQGEFWIETLELGEGTGAPVLPALESDIKGARLQRVRQRGLREIL